MGNLVPYCRQEMPSLDRLAGSVDPNTLYVMTISIDDDPVAAASAYYQTEQLTNLYPYGQTADRIGDKFGTGRAVPSAFFIDPQGKVLFRMVGTREWDSAPMMALFSRYINSGAQQAQ